MAPRCSTCGGSGLLNLGGGTAAKCPMCEGSGKQFDPGRKYSYLMGPITLNGSGSASSSNSLTGVLQNYATQVVNWPFRWMFSLQESTFPYLVQIIEGGEQRPFSNQQALSTLLFGDGRNPYPLPTPYEFPPNKNILASFTDLYGAVGTCGVTNGSAI